MVNLQFGLLVREVCSKPPSHAMRPVLSRRLGHSAIKILSHAGDGATESYRQWCCRCNVGLGITNDHANVTAGPVCILILEKREDNKIRM
jgi:hypothetical protein